MTWFFAVLVVLLMGAVAVVAGGRGGALAEAWDDRPDARVQADGPLTATDLRRVRLTTAFRGYRMSEVDALLDRLAEELEMAGRGSGTADTGRTGPALEPDQPLGPGQAGEGGQRSDAGRPDESTAGTRPPGED